MIKVIGKRLKKLIVYSIAFLLYYSGILALYIKKAFKEKILIVFYHEVGNNRELLGNIVTKPSYFENQINFLSKLFKPVSIYDLDSFLHRNLITGRPVLITFDGGYKGNLINAFPVLKEYRTPGLLYIVTESIDQGEVPWTIKLSYIFNTTTIDYLDYKYDDIQLFKGKITNPKKTLKIVKNKIYKYNSEQRNHIIREFSEILDVNLKSLDELFLNWNDISNLNQSELITFGSHTITHPRLNDISKDEARKEITGSKKIIEDKLGERIISFCYPDGNVGEEIHSLVKEAGYLNATTTLNGVNCLQTNPFLLRRIGGGNMPNFVFALKISGLFKFLNI